MSARYLVVGAERCPTCFEARRPWARAESPGRVYAQALYRCPHGVEVLASSRLVEPAPAALVRDADGFFVAAA